MIYKKAIKEINTVLNKKNTTAVMLINRSGNMDSMRIYGPDEGLSESWIIVECMLNLLCSEFKNERSAETLKRFLNKLGYFPTQDDVEKAYNAFLQSFPVPPTGKQDTSL